MGTEQIAAARRESVPTGAARQEPVSGGAARREPVSVAAVRRESGAVAAAVRVLLVAGGGDGRALGVALRGEGWCVVSAGVEFVAVAREFRPDVVVLHGIPADLRGRLAQLEEVVPEVPVLFVSGDVARAVARVRALVESAGERAPHLVVGDLVMDEEGREVTRGGVPVRLTATEFELLRYLMRNPRRVLSKAQILERVWGAGAGARGNLVELYISYLRRKIDVGAGRGVPMIHTRRGAGYVLKAADPGADAR
ncbi:winged helix-turn-helix transcriptional regulator [Streptomyces sp. NBU3104]|uniref:winged helix-turn-helix transcriptional regulator n=1 Tax=Streptomyces sp. NBU3104 TaxID=2911367 RepID=UPI001EDABBDC|nr:winged helix-turn-helix domain-containing protein [Streptomyces sp. NBU3104]UKL07057.1 winged helix-turn-helix domain-containing protein [Streptomyces sp. NBU3104]